MKVAKTFSGALDGYLADDKESDQIGEVKGDDVFPIEEGAGTPTHEEGPRGVQITVDTETDYDAFAKK